MMSGTSLDGIDFTLGEFSRNGHQWSYRPVKSLTYPYPDAWINRLSEAQNLSGEQLIMLHREYGFYIGSLINQFLESEDLKPDLAAIHGHTLFHNPAAGFNFQLGDGAAIAAITGLKVINDFRSLDVCLGGQGAPLVPIADRLLWSEYAACLNLGGFANVSFELAGQRIAFDIAPANLGLNYFARLAGHAYDKGGQLAKLGKVNNTLLSALEALPYYKLPAPKSLGREWFEQAFLPCTISVPCSPPDMLATLCMHLALRIRYELREAPAGNILITGGGAHNHYLIDCIRAQLPQFGVVVPDARIIDFKESIAFALLGVLRLTGEANCLKSVTGAGRDCCSGSITG